MQDKYPWDSAVSTKAGWNGHVEFFRHQVREVVNAKGCRVTVDSLDGLGSVSRPKGPQHKVGALALREICEAIDSTVVSNPIPHLDVVGVGVLRESDSFGLLRCEEALLAFRDLVQPLGGFLARFLHHTILQLC